MDDWEEVVINILLIILIVIGLGLFAAAIITLPGAISAFQAAGVLPGG